MSRDYCEVCGEENFDMLYDWEGKTMCRYCLIDELSEILFNDLDRIAEELGIRVHPPVGEDHYES